MIGLQVKLKEYKENPTVAIVVKDIKSYYFTVQGAIGGGGGEGGDGGGGKIPLLSHTTLDSSDYDGRRA